MIYKFLNTQYKKIYSTVQVVARGIYICRQMAFQNLLEEFYLLGYNTVHPFESQPTTRRYIAEERTLHNNCCDNDVKSYKSPLFILKSTETIQVHQNL
jgi:hypothetical protein